MDTLATVASWILLCFAGTGVTFYWERQRSLRLAQEEAAKRRARKREAIKATVAQLRKIESDYSHDPDELRVRANGAVAGLLVQLGCADVVDVWEWIACQKK